METHNDRNDENNSTVKEEFSNVNQPAFISVEQEDAMGLANNLNQGDESIAEYLDDEQVRNLFFLNGTYVCFSCEKHHIYAQLLIFVY